MPVPETRYAKVGDDRVAYQVLGEGPRDLIFSHGQWGHLDLDWEEPAIARFYRRMASFSRLIRFNTRGSGLSDPRPQDGRDASQHWMEDVLAVMDAAGSRSAAMMGAIDGGTLALQFAAAHPQRVHALAVLNAWARIGATPDYPIGHSPEAVEQFLAFTHKYFATERWVRASNPSLAGDERALQWQAKWLRAQVSPRRIVESFATQQMLDIRPVLRDILAPTLVMTRRKGVWVTEAMGRYLAEQIAGARFVELPGGDSGPFWETPELILDLVEEFFTGVRHGGEPDRMLAAVLFTDIVGSTERAARLGDAAWRALLDQHDHILREQVGLFGGKIADHAGDGSLSTFDSPRRAIDCALALQTALSGIGIEIRVGTHFGEVERRDDGRVGGIGVHIGARIMALAQAGEILLSHTAQGVLAGSRYRFEDRGVHELKGVPGKWMISAVATETAS